MEPHNYVVIKFEGEYVTLKDTDSGDELFIAAALLPFGIDMGTKLRYENLVYEIIE